MKRVSRSLLLLKLQSVIIKIITAGKTAIVGDDTIFGDSGFPVHALRITSVTHVRMGFK